MDILKALKDKRNEHQRRVSTTLRHMLTEFSEFFHVSWTGLLIHASVGTAGGLGALRTEGHWRYPKELMTSRVTVLTSAL